MKQSEVTLVFPDGSRYGFHKSSSWTVKHSNEWEEGQPLFDIKDDNYLREILTELERTFRGLCNSDP
jgi:hypothetical protein